MKKAAFDLMASLVPGGGLAGMWGYGVPAVGPASSNVPHGLAAPHSCFPFGVNRDKYPDPHNQVQLREHNTEGLSNMLQGLCKPKELLPVSR